MPEEYFKTLPLDILRSLHADAVKQLYESKERDDDPQEIERKKRMVELIRKVIAAKEATPPKK